MAEKVIDKNKLKSVQYFKEICIEDEDQLIPMGILAQKDVYDNFCVNLRFPETVFAVYACIFDAIREVLKDYSEKQSSYSINIANRLEVGFTTTYDTDDSKHMEKAGNFMFYLRHIENNSLTEVNHEERRSVVLCTQWNASNVKSSIDAIKKICARSLKIIEDRLSLSIGSPEVIIPVFCTIHQDIVKYAMIAREQSGEFEYRANIVGCYDIYVRQLDDGINVGFKPAIYDKGSMKHDGKATATYDE